MRAVDQDSRIENRAKASFSAVDRLTEPSQLPENSSSAQRGGQAAVPGLARCLFLCMFKETPSEARGFSSAGVNEITSKRDGVLVA